MSTLWMELDEIAVRLNCFYIRCAFDSGIRFPLATVGDGQHDKGFVTAEAKMNQELGENPV